MSVNPLNALHLLVKSAPAFVNDIRIASSDASIPPSVVILFNVAIVSVSFVYGTGLLDFIKKTIIPKTAESKRFVD